VLKQCIEVKSGSRRGVDAEPRRVEMQAADAFYRRLLL
jgi:hypothetical protein